MERRRSAVSWVVVLCTATAVGGACGGEDEREAAPGLVEVSTLQTRSAFHEPASDDSRLVGPNFEIAIDRVAVAESSSDLFFDVPDRQRFRAPEGHELVAATLTANPRLDPEEVPPAHVEVGQGEEMIDMPGTGETIVAVVPQGDSARLLVRDLGRSQSIDLRTGERGSDAIDGFYTDVGQVLEHTYTGSAALPPLIPFTPLPPPYGSIGSPPVPAEVEITIDTVLRRPWLPGPDTGYAAVGRAWLAFEASLGVTGMLSSGCGAVPYLQTELTFSLIDDAGRQLRPQLGYVGDVPSSLVVFDVPADFTTGTLRIDPGASPILNALPVDTDPCAWVTPPAAATIPLHLVEA